MVYVDEKHCLGCGLCVDACPFGAIRVENGIARVEQSLCSGCGECVASCPEGALIEKQVPAVVGASADATAVARSEGMSHPDAPIRHVPREEHRRGELAAHIGSTAVPWVGAALAFVGREIVPHVVQHLTDRYRYGAGSGAESYQDLGTARTPHGQGAGRRGLGQGAGRRGLGQRAGRVLGRRGGRGAGKTGGRGRRARRRQGR